MAPWFYPWSVNRKLNKFIQCFGPNSKHSPILFLSVSEACAGPNWIENKWQSVFIKSIHSSRFRCVNPNYMCDLDEYMNYVCTSWHNHKRKHHKTEIYVSAIFGKSDNANTSTHTRTDTVTIVNLCCFKLSIIVPFACVVSMNWISTKKPQCDCISFWQIHCNNSVHSTLNSSVVRSVACCWQQFYIRNMCVSISRYSSPSLFLSIHRLHRQNMPREMTMAMNEIKWTYTADGILDW